MIVSKVSRRRQRVWWKGAEGEGTSESRQRVQGFSSENPGAFSRTSNRELCGEEGKRSTLAEREKSEDNPS